MARAYAHRDSAQDLACQSGACAYLWILRTGACSHMAQHRGGTDAGQQEAAAKGKRSSLLDLRWSTYHTPTLSVTAMLLIQGDVCVCGTLILLQAQAMSLHLE